MGRAYLLLAATVAAGLTACGAGTTAGPAASSAQAPAATAGNNGIAGNKPEEVLARTRAALAAASAVRVKGNLPTEGQVTAIDLRIGKGLIGRGTITRGKVRVELLRRGSVVFVRGNAAFHPAGTPAGAERLYLRMTTKDAKVADFAQLLDLRAMADELVPKSTTGLTLGKEVIVRGQPAVPLVSKDATILVAATGQPRPLQIAGGAYGRVDYLDYDVPVRVAEPAAEDMLDLG